MSDRIFQKVVGRDDAFPIFIGASAHDRVLVRQDDAVLCFTPERAEELSEAIMLAAAAALKAKAGAK